MAEVLETRALLTTFIGTTAATFENAVGGVTAGEGTSTFNWGESFEGNEINEFDIDTNGIDIEQDQQFSLGTLSYFNGITLVGTDSESVDLVVRLNLTAPELDSEPGVEQTLRMSATPNTGTPDENADIITLAGETSVSFRVGDEDYALRVLGFGATTDNTFTPVEELVIRELESTTVELIAEFIPLSDLRAAQLTTDQTSFVGSETDFRVVVKNRGNGPATEGFKARLVLSMTPDFDADNHLVIREIETTQSLSPGRRVVLSGTFTLPTDLPQEYSGEVFVGVIIDPDDTVIEGNENNNAPHRLRRSLALFDPVPTPEIMSNAQDEPLTFGSRREALRFLKAEGYENLAQDEPGERSLSLGERFSRRTGEIMDAGAFRAVAVPQRVARGEWVIERRVGEPTPGAARIWRSEFDSRSAAARYLRFWNQESDDLF